MISRLRQECRSGCVRAALLGLVAASVGVAFCARVEAAEALPPPAASPVRATYEVTVQRLWFDDGGKRIASTQLRGKLQIEMDRERGPGDVTARVTSTILATRGGAEPPAHAEQDSAGFKCTVSASGIADVVPLTADDGKNPTRAHAPLVQALMGIFPPLPPNSRAGEVWVANGHGEPLERRMYSAYQSSFQDAMVIVGVQSHILPNPADQGTVHMVETIQSVMDGWSARFATISRTVSGTNPNHTVIMICRSEGEPGGGSEP